MYVKTRGDTNTGGEMAGMSSSRHEMRPTIIQGSDPGLSWII